MTDADLLKRFGVTERLPAIQLAKSLLKTRAVARGLWYDVSQTKSSFPKIFDKISTVKCLTRLDATLMPIVATSACRGIDVLRVDEEELDETEAKKIISLLTHLMPLDKVIVFFVDEYRQVVRFGLEERREAILAQAPDEFPRITSPCEPAEALSVLTHGAGEEAKNIKLRELHRKLNAAKSTRQKDKIIAEIRRLRQSEMV